MAFDSFEHFLAMGTHGYYVWSSYGIFFLSLLLCIAHSIRGRSLQKKRLYSRIEKLTGRPNEKDLRNKSNAS